MKTKALLLLLSSNFIMLTGWAQEWGVSTGYDTLAAQNSLLAFTQIHTSGERVFLGDVTSAYVNKLYYSDDNGLSWTESASDATYNFALFDNSKESMYSFGYSLFGPSIIRKSEDEGTTWKVTEMDRANFPFIFIPAHFEAINDTLILTSTARNAGMLKSVDGGANWSSFNTFEDGDGNKSLVSLDSYGDYFYLLTNTNGRGVFRSHKDSTSWEWVYEQDSGDNMIVDHENGRIILLAAGEVHYSDDEGETWSVISKEDLGDELSSGTFDEIAIKGDKYIVSILDASTNGYPRILEIDRSLTENSATDISEGLTNYEQGNTLFSLTANSTVVFAGRINQESNKRQLWTFPSQSGPAVSNESEEIHEMQFGLSQNYPNPFNPTTTISFKMLKAGAVSLKIFNMLGQEVATLVNGKMSSGEQAIQFDASDLASGMYIYRLQAGHSTQTRKMMLIK